MIEVKKMLMSALKNAVISLWSVVLALWLNSRISNLLEKIFIVANVSSKISKPIITVVKPIIITFLATLIYVLILFVIFNSRAKTGISVYKNNDSLKTDNCQLSFADQDACAQILVYNLNFFAGNPISFWFIKRIGVGIRLRFNPESIIISDADEDPKQKQNIDKYENSLFIPISDGKEYRTKPFKSTHKIAVGAKFRYQQDVDFKVGFARQSKSKVKSCWYARLFIYFFEVPKLIFYIRDNYDGK